MRDLQVYFNQICVMGVCEVCL